MAELNTISYSNYPSMKNKLRKKAKTKLCAPKAGGMGLIPGWRMKIPHAAGQLRQGPQLLKLAQLEPMFHNKKSHHNEEPANRN